MSLSKCIKATAKLNDGDVTSVLDAYDSYIETMDSVQAAKHAIDDVISSVKSEKKEYVDLFNEAYPNALKESGQNNDLTDKVKEPEKPKEKVDMPFKPEPKIKSVKPTAEEVTESKQPENFEQADKSEKTKPKKSITADHLNRLVKILQRENPGTRFINFHIRETQDEAFGPGSTKEHGVIKGGFYSGSDEVVLIAENIKDVNDAITVIRHEVVGHYGLRQLLNKEGAYDKLLKRVYDSRNGELKELYDWAAKAYPDLVSKGDIRGIADEMLARATETKTDSSLLKEIYDLIIKLLNKVGLVFDNISRKEVDSLIRSSAKNLKKGTLASRRNYSPTTANRVEDVDAPTFYSQLENVLAEKLPGKGTPKQLLDQINNYAKKGLVKKDEVEWSGVIEWLDSLGSKKVTKNEVVDFMRANQIKVDEVIKGSIDDSLVFAEGYKTRGELTNTIETDDQLVDSDGYLKKGLEVVQVDGLWNLSDKNTINTKHSDHVLPGGKNYKELLLTLPSTDNIADPKNWEEAGRLMSKYNISGDASPLESDAAAFERIGKEIRNKNRPEVFTSAHYKEENILAHIRYNERTDANGKKVLFIEEIQSDWHQDGRKTGYKGKRPIAEKIKAKYKLSGQDHMRWQQDVLEREGVSDTDIDAWLDERKTAINGVPDAPFKTSWPLLSIKRMIHYAAENGFDKISWTTGEQQADRYDLSKQFDSVTAARSSFGEYFIDITKDGDIISSNKITESDLPNFLGRDLAQKIIDSTEVQAGDKTLFSGFDLKVGGEGMKTFYDKMLPSIVNKYVKKWGGKVGVDSIVTGTENQRDLDIDLLDDLGVESGSKGVTPSVKVHSLEITEPMKESVIKGQPLFSKQPPTPNQDINDAPADGEDSRFNNSPKKSIIKQWLKRNLTKEGLMNKTAFDIKLKSDAIKNVGEEEISYLVYNFEKTIKTTYKKSYNNLDSGELEKINNYLSGNKSVQLPVSVKGSLDLMRSQLDVMSIEMLKSIRDILMMKVGRLSSDRREQYQLYVNTDGKNGSVQPHIESTLNLMNKMLDNVGIYLTRSYQAFDDVNWKDKALNDSVLISDASDFIREQNPDLSESEVIGAVRAILQDAKDSGNFATLISKGSKIGTKDVTITKKRKDVPEVIRRLLGEYKDPKVNFVRSASKMQWYIANHYFLMNLREKGINDFIYEIPTGEYDARIATKGSEAMNPLDGLFTTEEFKQGMEDAVNGWDGSDLMRNLVRINSMIKYGKTILSPTTQARNFQSAAMFSIMNGHFNWMHSVKAFKVAKSDLFTKDKEWKKYINDLIGLGVLHDNPYAGELREAINDVTELDIYSKGVFQSSKKFLNWMQKSYQVGDDFWKIIGFENELNSLLKSGMAESEAKKKAAYRIRNGYPTYSMIPRAIKKIRRWPLIGSFVSFPYEIIRTSYNQFELIADDHKAGRSAMRNKRILGIAIASAAAYSASQISMMMMGLSDEDDEAVKAQLPEWSRNSQIMYMGYDDDGLPIYIDLSFIDPYTYLKKPISALLSGNNESAKDKALDAMTELAEPFLGTDIAAGIVLETWMNKKSGGGQVYNPEDDSLSMVTDMVNHVRKGIQPGILSNIEKTILAIKGDVSPSGKEYKIKDESLAWLGYRVGTLNLNQSMIYKGYEFTDKLRLATRLLNKKIGTQGKISDDEIEASFNKMIKSRESNYRKMIKYIEGARALGVTDNDIKKSLSAANISISKSSKLMRGEIPKWKMSRQFSKSARDRAIASASNQDRKDEIREEMQSRKAMVRMLANEYISDY